jgi:plastocyanin
MYMNYIFNQNSLVILLILFTLALSVTSSPISQSREVLAKSEHSSDGGGSDNGNNGKGHDKGGGSDDGNDGGSDDGNDGGSDDGNDGGSDDGNDGGSDDGNDGGSQSSANNFQIGTKNQQSDNNNVDQPASSIVDPTIEDRYGSKVFYVLIKSENNKTIFVPEKVTLTTGSTVVWLNQDRSDHTISVASNSKSEYALLNSLILPSGMVDQKFQSAGTFYYKDIENPQSEGVVTILNNGEKDNSTAIPIE